MTCQMCTDAVAQELRKVRGVEVTSVREGEAMFRLDNSIVDLDQVKARVEEAGKPWHDFKVIRTEIA